MAFYQVHTWKMGLHVYFPSSYQWKDRISFPFIRRKTFDSHSHGLASDVAVSCNYPISKALDRGEESSKFM